MTTIGPTRPPLIPALRDPIARGGGLTWDFDQLAGDYISDIVSMLGTGASGGWQGLWPQFKPWITLPDATPTHVSSITDASGLGRGVTQSTDAMRPIYDVASPVLSGRGSSYPAASASMASSAINLSAFRYVACVIVYTDSITSLVGSIDFGGSVNGRCTLAANNGSAGTLSVFGKAAAGDSEARSAASFAMTTVGIVMGIVDYDATTNCTTIYHNGIDVTASRPDNSNLSASSPANGAVTIGALTGPSNNITGNIGWAGLLAFNTLPIATLTGPLVTRTRGFYGF